MTTRREGVRAAPATGPTPRAAPPRRGGWAGGGTGALLARLLAAVAGGYAVANLVVIALGVALPIVRLDAVHTGFLLGFAVHAAAVVWTFAAASAGRAWLGLAAAAVPCLAVIGVARLAGGG